ncbi:MAG: GGDEF and EAL domain-containing protein [Pseudomonas oryzihabitans]|uniref:putative bifunctional diguanylate cyclase/phosphodiesterase n=1 Tax=Pseudomonas oryzihabitans TaxID=47885 RepID=UPI0029116AF2|nr:GGDEF and EAL domain-containing protein [Pseudomonas oryzihabitans]MDU4055637.1 GGDEF and EAL domain-containing protein [Pseudomonas oryzihabitans]
MEPAPLTAANERQRLALLRDLALIDRPADRAFQDLTDLCARLFDVPYAMICFLDGQQVHCRATVGCAPFTVPRTQSFCQHLQESALPLQVEDARDDARFADLQVVRGAPNIRYYLGAPLRTAEGLMLGSLCLFDAAPRAALPQDRLVALQQLAALASQHIELLRTEAFWDPVTQLPNGQRFSEDAEALARAGTSVVAVAADLFAQSYLNDFIKAMGQAHFDGLQRAIKQHLRRLLPAEQPLYRLGPARFGFLLHDDDEAAQRALLERLQQELTGVLDYNGIPIQTRLGLGVMSLTDDHPTDWLRALIATADDARAEMRGCRYFDPQHDAAYRRAFALLSALPQALRAEDQLSLVYQPRIDLATGRCHSVEALLRWQHPHLGPVSPAEFIPLAEKTALITALSRWVMQQAISQAYAWQREGRGLGVAINISAHDLNDPDFTEHTTDLLQRYPVDPRRLELEVTENALLGDVALIHRQLAALRELGIGIAIDDFGTGYNNLSHLRELPADTIKIDRSFVRELTHRTKDRLIVSSLIELSHQLGFRITAEGIETAEALASLLAMGCDEGQGFWIGKPMPEPELQAWLLIQQPDLQRRPTRRAPVFQLFDNAAKH